jgi:MFS family permease
MAESNVATVPGKGAGITKEEKMVIFASSLGTVFEWYDFYLYGSLAAVISANFFKAVNETTSFIFALLAFAAGFFVRPFGAIVFGRLGDLIGRKYTFLVTILLMGGATFIVGILPTYNTWGIVAPIILITMRILQGLALGGEYGGAATYVAEHAPNGQRGYFTSFIQTTATLGLFLSLIVIMVTRIVVNGNFAKVLIDGKDVLPFDAWGWRVPFLLSAVLVGISVWIRLQLNESPIFKKMKEEGKVSRAPLTESFLRWGNLKIVLLVLFGGVAGQGVVWYTGMFYELFFLVQIVRMDAQTANLIVAFSLIIGTPFFIIFGALSDWIGRKWIIMAGCALAVVTYQPIFREIVKNANPYLAAATEEQPVRVFADPATCTFQFDPIGKAKFKTSCDLLKGYLAKNAIPYTNVAGAPGAPAYVEIGKVGAADLKRIDSFEGTVVDDATFAKSKGALEGELKKSLTAYLKDPKVITASANIPWVIFYLVILVIYVTMVYAPIGAWLVELFPARIRYTSMSLPYHIGNGWFGGFLPTIAFAIVAATGDIFAGLYYAMTIAAMTVVVGSLLMKDTDTQGSISHLE